MDMLVTVSSCGYVCLWQPSILLRKRIASHYINIICTKSFSKMLAEFVELQC